MDRTEEVIDKIFQDLRSLTLPKFEAERLMGVLHRALGGYLEKECATNEFIFDSQIQTLAYYGCPQLIIDELASKKPKVLSRANKMIFEADSVHFLPVIPVDKLDFTVQLKMLRIGEDIIEESHSYDSPHPMILGGKLGYIFNVNAGMRIRDMGYEDIQHSFKRRGRRGLNIFEVLSLCLHTGLLSRDFFNHVYAFGSPTYKDLIPSLDLGRVLMRGYYVRLWTDRFDGPEQKFSFVASCDK